jgi:ABC-type glycerol-3-phosphate transport system substrate-binding protein
MRLRQNLLLAAAALTSAATVTACSAGSSGNAAGDGGKPHGQVVVWDYYGSATPLKPAIADFKKSHPEITVKYEALDYDTIQDKFSVAVSSGAAPDLATLDMTWLPTYAANGTLQDISKISGGKLNGAPITAQYTPGALGAMTYDKHYVAAMYDFDAYALYYRKDILDERGIAVPKTWDDLVSATQKMAEDTNGDGKPDKYAFQVLPDTFHYAQLLFQNGGSILDPAEKKATFNSPAGVAALDYMKRLLDAGGSLYWGSSQGDSTGLPGIKDNRIGMFINGPYMMGVLKDGAKDQSGDWAVAPAPYSVKQGSYLGGTGLVIPTGAKNPTAAWELAQFLLQPKEQALVYTAAGAAPATTAALEQPALSAPDPYFGGQAPFPIFLSSMSTATHYPYVSAWPDMDAAITDAVDSVLLGKASAQEALDKAAKTVDGKLGE